MSHYAHLLAALCDKPSLDLHLLDEAMAALEIDGRELFIHPARDSHPAEPPHGLEITVTVMHRPMPGDEDDVEALLILHRLNALSLGVHRWRVGVDEEGLVSLRQRVTVESLSPDDLEALMIDGVDRAAIVEALLQEQLGPPVLAEQALSLRDLLAGSFIKG
jgi:hypothetical protein